MKHNVVLCTFNQHVIAHYLRYLQYGNHKDKLAYMFMNTHGNEKHRKMRASLAGSIGGTNQQIKLREKKLGWFNSKIQQKLGRKGAASARIRNVGAFDLRNKIKADIAWKKKYKNDKSFREKMKKNLVKGLKTQKQKKINIGNPLQQRIKSVNFRGILVNNKRLNTPYRSFSLQTGKFEYTDARVHMSEDFFWYSIYKT